MVIVGWVLDWSSFFIFWKEGNRRDFERTKRSLSVAVIMTHRFQQEIRPAKQQASRCHKMQVNKGRLMGTPLREPRAKGV